MDSRNLNGEEVEALGAHATTRAGRHQTSYSRDTPNGELKNLRLVILSRQLDDADSYVRGSRLCLYAAIVLWKGRPTVDIGAFLLTETGKPNHQSSSIRP